MPGGKARRGHPALPFPGPVPRIGLASSAVTGQFSLPWVQCSSIEGLSPRDPEASLAATLTPIAHPAFSRRLVWGGLVAGRRLPPCPHLIASHGLL
jgi:hypothetical protein